MIYYAGIGSRETPLDVCREMTALGEAFSAIGLVLRSGGARGADQAFERRVPSDRRQVFLASAEARAYPTWAEAARLAADVHPAWHRCSAYARDLHTRNGFQVLGQSLREPSVFVVCWTKDGGPSGGTGQALRLAARHGIPVFNMHDESVRQTLRDVVRSPFSLRLFVLAKGIG